MTLAEFHRFPPAATFTVGYVKIFVYRYHKNPQADKPIVLLMCSIGLLDRF